LANGIGCDFHLRKKKVQPFLFIYIGFFHDFSMVDFVLLVRNWDFPNYMTMYIAGGVLLNATMHMG
jgi:hypothetical protein